MKTLEQIPGIKSKNFRNPTHLEYNQDVLSKATASAGITAHMTSKLEAYRKAVEAEAEANLWVAKSLLTKKLRDKDAERDEALKSLRKAIESMLGYPEEGMKELAEDMLEITNIQKVSGAEQYDLETGKLTVLCEQLLVEHRQTIERLRVLPWAENLKRLNDEMCQMLIERDQQLGDKGKSQIADCRVNTEDAYHELIFAVNAYTFLNGTEGFTPFINYMKALIDRMNREVLKSTSTKPGATEEEETEEVEEETTEEVEGEGGGNTGGSDDSTGGGDTGGSTGGGVIYPGEPGEDTDL